MPSQGHRSGASQSKSGLKGYLKLHRQGFISLVSLSLLLSLIAREWVRDTAKEEADKLSAARNMFYLRVDSLGFADNIAENIEAGKISPSDAHLTKDQVETQLKDQLKTDFRASMVSNHMGDTLSNLAKVVDLSSEEGAKVDALYDQNLERAHRFESLSKSLEAHTATEQDLNAAKKIANDASAIDWTIFDLGTILCDRADREVLRQETIYKWSSLLASLLAVWLWYLFFLGRRYDIDLPEVEG